MYLNRRRFLQAGALSFVALGGVGPRFLRRIARADALPTPPPHWPKTLVVVFQRGAVDGLSMVVPHGEPSYYADRARLAIPAASVVDLDGHFGLHPSLAPLKPLWDSHQLAIVHACGSPDPSRSHFDAQHAMETGTLVADAPELADGFLNRCLALPRPPPAEDRDIVARYPEDRAVAMGTSLPDLLAGPAPALVIEDLSRFGLNVRNDGLRAELERAFANLYSTDDGPVGTAGAAALSAVTRLRDLAAQAMPPANGAVYPRGQLGRRFSQLATLLKSSLGVELACIDTGGWDTHTGQGDATQGRLSPLLRDLGGALAAFAADMGPAMSNVVVVTVSEFGRTVAQNGTGGTDHGHGNVMLAFGGPVRGGRIVGHWPGLDATHRYEGRDLAVTTDYRDVFCELLSRHMGVTALDTIFPGFVITPANTPGLC